MPNFIYQALDANGQTSNGVVAAPGRAAAIEQVVGRGLHPVKVEEKADRRGATGGLFPASGRVSAAQAETFTRELANLLTAGVSLSRALHILAREASSPAARKQWDHIREEVTGGAALADAMAGLPRTFTPVNVAMVRAGEQGGFLDVVLSQIADFRARERDLMGRVKAAMIYPAILATLMVGVVIFLLTYFIPKFTGIFDEFGAALPRLTQAIVLVSDAVRDYGLFVALAIVAAVILIRRSLGSDSGRRTMEKIVLGTPGLGVVSARFALVRFCRMLGTLIGSGVPLISALRTSRDALGNQTLHDAVTLAIEQVQQGESLARSLSTCPRLFPASVIEMIAIAEETGRLDKELVRLSTTYEAELDRRLRMLVSMLEPLLLFVMAAVVGTIVVGMLLPVFTLQDLIK